MKNKTQNTQRRFKVGDYWASVRGNEIVVFYYEYGEEEEVARFNKSDIDKIQGIDSEKAKAALAEKEKRIRELSALRDTLYAAYNQTRSELSRVMSQRPDLTQVGDYFVAATPDTVTVGCTEISRRQFNRIAKLL
jgi:hypothetical protein